MPAHAARAERARREEEAARREAEERAKRAAEERALREAEEAAAAAAAAVAAAEEAEARAAMEAEERARAAEAARRAALVALHGPSPGLCECSWADLGVAGPVLAGWAAGTATALPLAVSTTLFSAQDSAEPISGLL